MLTDEGVLNLEVKTSIESPGLLGDLKAIVFFDQKSYLIAAINTQILFFEITLDGTLVKKYGIKNQILIQSIKVHKIERLSADKPNLKGVEILVCDVMKSFSVYLVSFDQNQVSSINAAASRFASMQNNQLKSRFPFGQWCISAQRMDSADMNSDYYLTSFHDFSFALLQGKPGQSSLSIMSASNIGERVNSMQQLEQSMRIAKNQVNNEMLLSKTFISSNYLRSSVLTQNKSFFDTDGQEYSLQNISDLLASSSKAIVCTSEGTVMTVTLLPDSPLVQLLVHIQKSLSSVIGTNEDCNFNKMTTPTLHGLNNVES